MTTITQEIKNLGFDDCFNASNLNAAMAGHEVARVISVHRDHCIISQGKGHATAELSGKLLYASDSPLDRPAVGDWVYANFYDVDHAIIHGILPRQTQLKRKSAGKDIEHQLIATNIDAAFIIQSLDDNFNIRRLERYLVMVNESNIVPIVLLTKADLMHEDEIQEKIKCINAVAPKIKVLALSCEKNTNMDEFKRIFIPQKTYCLLGSSGVGKTTLLNHLDNTHTFQTQSVSRKESKGRHTTTHRHLVCLASGALLIDTPGMRELGSLDVNTGMSETFSEIVTLMSQCKFGNCSHNNEKGCAVLAAIESEGLSEGRYKNYLSMKKEAEFNDMSNFDKRQKNKAVGQMIKSVIKERKKR